MSFDARLAPHRLGHIAKRSERAQRGEQAHAYRLAFSDIWRAGLHPELLDVRLERLELEHKMVELAKEALGVLRFRRADLGPRQGAAAACRHCAKAQRTQP